MKLKLDENGHVVVQDGHPVYTHDDGKDVPFDAKAAADRITALNGEAMRHRQSKEEVEGKLKAFDGITSVEEARRAMETVANLKSGELQTSEQVQRIKDEARRAAEEQVQQAKRADGERIQQLQSDLAAVSNKYDGEVVTNNFANSKFVKDKVAWPADAVQKIFGGQFKHEDGKLVGYDSSGNKIFSRRQPGEVAGFDEALELAIDAYPHRDNMLKGTESSGSGARQGHGGGVNGKTMTRKHFATLDPSAQRKAVVEDKFQVVD